MRIALHATGPVGSRTARVLLAERSLTALGLVGRRSALRDDRISTITSLEGWDVLVSDDLETMERSARGAIEANLPLVLCGDDLERLNLLESPAIPIVVGANPRAGLAAGLAARESERHENLLEVVVGWTEPGRPLRRGRSLTFPQPVGNAWGREGVDIWPGAPPGTVFLTAPVEGPWSALMARVTAATTEGVEVRTLGVADDDAYLAAIALAAGGITASAGFFPPGIHYPTAAADEYLDAALSAGLEIATFVELR